MPETNNNTVEGSKRAWSLVFWLMLIGAVVIVSLLSGLSESNGPTDLAFAAERLAEGVASRVSGTVLLATLLVALLLRWRSRRIDKGQTCSVKRDE